MAHKTFISYKYSDGRITRDRIIQALGTDAVYYKGETVDSPDMGTLKVASIKRNLSNMLFDTSVLIVVVSPNVDLSKWVQWEIDYATHKSSRSGRQSQSNGVIIAVDDSIVRTRNEKFYDNHHVTQQIQSSGTYWVLTSVSRLLKNLNNLIDQAYDGSHGN